MITASDSFNTYDINKYCNSPVVTKWNIDEFINEFSAKKVKPGLNYNSGTNDNWESVGSLKDD